MVCKIPAHIFDIDQATAERIVRRIVLRRRMKVAALCMAVLGVITGAVAALAV